MSFRLLVSSLALCLLTSSAFAQRKPNVLFIVADDLRPELNCYGARHVKSPQLDRLAAQGVRFDAAYCQYTVCNPSRTSLLTGLRPDTTRIVDNSTNFRKTIPDVVTLPQLFKQNGYYTVSLGKIFHRGLTMEDTKAEMDDQPSWNEARYFQTTERGFKGAGRNLTNGALAWCRTLAAEGEDEDQPDGQSAQYTIQLLEKFANNRQPFFIGLGLHKPHDPFIAPKKYFDLYPLARLMLPAVNQPLPADMRFALGGGNFATEFAKFGDAERREFKQAYLAGASFIDAQVGKVLDALQRLKLADNTIIVFFGDHGYHLGERGWWNKNTLYELSARVPLIITAPQKMARGKASPSLVELLDLYPTLADLAGLAAPKNLQGRSLKPLLTNPRATVKTGALTQVFRGQGVMGYSLRTARWRYTEWAGGQHGVELYDHQSDRDELHNLAQSPRHAATVKQLQQQMNALTKSAKN